MQEGKTRDKNDQAGQKIGRRIKWKRRYLGQDGLERTGSQCHEHSASKAGRQKTQQQQRDRPGDRRVCFQGVAGRASGSPSRIRTRTAGVPPTANDSEDIERRTVTYSTVQNHKRDAPRSVESTQNRGFLDDPTRIEKQRKEGITRQQRIAG